jgi:DNA-binding transcriptional MerR regulator
MNKRLSIKDLENISGIKAHTIRMWEKRHNIFDPERTETNIRLYSSDDLTKLLNISSVLEHGMKISKISTLSREELNNQIEIIQQENVEASKKIVINKLIVATLKCSVIDFEKTYKNHSVKHGLENTIEKIIYPMLIQIGIMWTVSKLNPSQEHFASQMIRQKLFSAIDLLPDASKKDSRYVLYLPDDEDHEIGLLYAYYLIKKAGHECIYLGPSVPVIDVGECCMNSNATSVLCTFTIPRHESVLNTYLNTMKAVCPSVKLLVHGLPSHIDSQLNDPQFNFLYDLQDLKNII